jgi:ADP-ribosylglycohydrolase
MGKKVSYTELCDGFRYGSPYIRAAAFGKFARILRADIRNIPESGIKSGGYVIDTLETAFRCFLTTDSYPAAVTGALAGLDTLAAAGEIRRLSGAMAGTLAA